MPGGPIEPAELYRLGAEEYKRGKYESAVEYFTQALEQDPKFFRALVYRGMACYENDMLEDAIQDFRSALRIDSNYAKAHNGLGNALRKKGYLVEALQSYKKAARLEPKQSLYHHNLGITSCDMGLYDIAVLELEYAALSDAQSIDIRYDLGSAYYLKGDLPQAIRAFETCLEIDAEAERAPEIQAKIKGLRRKLEEQKNRPAEPKMKPPKKERKGEAEE
ncbi:MAG: tetratricopeptide repeat protein [Planctomycetes bacterium]|nr:tetratricopeptide repeat protein [Planctomycetota bacterium]